MTKPKLNQCKICFSPTNIIFTKKILNKYNVSFYQCENCLFLQTEKPYWLKQSYSNAITSQDIGLLGRNIYYSNITEKLIYSDFRKSNKYLDYGGGYGIFTRLMRDKGINFYHYDKLCQNLFAQHFTIDDLPKNKRTFELTTSFEMMEHIYNPYQELDKIFSKTSNFLFTTETLPQSDISNWWYLGTEHGQHISFYSFKSLELLAKHYHLNYFHNGRSLHLMTKNNFSSINKSENKLQKILKLIKEEVSPASKLDSLTPIDYKKIIKISE